MAQELEGAGVTANVLVPGGATNTNLIAQIPYARAALIQPEVMQAPAVGWRPASPACNGRRLIAYYWDERLPLEERLAKASAPAAWPNSGDRLFRQADDEWISSIGNGTRLMTAFCLPRKGTTMPRTRWYALVIWLIAMAVWVAQLWPSQTFCCGSDPSHSHLPAGDVGQADLSKPLGNSRPIASFSPRQC